MSNSSLWFRADVKSDKDASTSRQNVSFKFSKHTPKTLTVNKLDDESAAKTRDRESVLSVEDKEIKSSVPKETKKKLVVPPLHDTVWQHVSSVSNEKGEEGTSEKSVNELAVEELLKESAEKNAKWKNREGQNIVILNPIIQSKGSETDEKLDLATLPEGATLEDFESIPVTSFGVAVMRGWGVKPGDPIGNTNKRFVEPIDPRSSSLNFGPGKEAQKNSKVKAEEELQLVRQAYIHVIQGTHKGSYGQVESLDESYVIVKLTKQDENVVLPISCVEVISKKEFQKESKVINKESYDKYKNETTVENGHEPQSSSRNQEENSSRNHQSKSAFHPDVQKRLQADETDDSHHHSQNKHNSKSKRKHSKDRESSHKKQSSDQQKPESWVRPLLRVRFIDENYKKGKYYNQKLVVEDVLSPESCVCVTEDGKYLEDLLPSMLETVIPRSKPSHVMIVSGKHKTQVGTVLKRDKKNCVATVQLLSDRSRILELAYDSICEYVGDISPFD